VRSIPRAAYEVPVALISGGVGLTTGAIGSLFAPWANWGVEKRRLKHQRRVDRIKEWRDGVKNLGAGHESRCATNHIGRVLLATHCQEYATLA
jgi:hypothetical protein